MDIEKEFNFYKTQIERIDLDIATEKTFNNNERYCQFLQARTACVNSAMQLESILKKNKEEEERKKENQEYLENN